MKNTIFSKMVAGLMLAGSMVAVQLNAQNSIPAPGGGGMNQGSATSVPRPGGGGSGGTSMPAPGSGGAFTPNNPSNGIGWNPGPNLGWSNGPGWNGGSSVNWGGMNWNPGVNWNSNPAIQNRGYLQVMACGYDNQGVWRVLPLQLAYLYNGIQYNVNIINAWDPWTDSWNYNVDQQAFSTLYYLRGIQFNYYVVLTTGTYYFNL